METLCLYGNINVGAKIICVVSMKSDMLKLSTLYPNFRSETLSLAIRHQRSLLLPNIENLLQIKDNNIRVVIYNLMKFSRCLDKIYLGNIL